MSSNNAQRNMIEQQIRPWNVFSVAVLNALNKVKREDFVAEAQKSLAYADMQLPIGFDQHMFEPKVEARLLQTLDLGDDDLVLEIGTGSGFVTALLCELAKSVSSVDIHAQLTDAARTRLEKYGYGNFLLQTADALSPTYSVSGEYHVIVLGGAVKEVPQQLLNSLKIDGRMFAFISGQYFDRAVLIKRLDEDKWHEELIFEASVGSLVNQPLTVKEFIL